MNEDWVVVHEKRKVFIKSLGHYSAIVDRMVPIWTKYPQKARCFPSESAALAVIEEWSLEEVAGAAVICQSEE